jgi:hypothetical protein
MPTSEEWAEAAWKIQGWVRSCFDVAGVCTLCGTKDPAVHVNDCPWPEMRALLDRAPLPDYLPPLIAPEWMTNV